MLSFNDAQNLFYQNNQTLIDDLSIQIDNAIKHAFNQYPNGIICSLKNEVDPLIVSKIAEDYKPVGWIIQYTETPSSNYLQYYFTITKATA